MGNKSQKMKTFVFGATLALAIGVIAAAGFHNVNQTAADVSALTYTLDGTNAPASLTADSYTTVTGNSVSTSSGNPLLWDYNYCKATASGHAIIGKNTILNPDGTKYYIGNTSPFSGVKTLTVNFSGVDYVYVFASNDGTNYVRIQDLTVTGSNVTFATDYQYFRIVNGAQSKTDCLLTSLVFTYTCNHENTTEIADRSNSIGSITSGTTYAYDSNVHRDGGTKSLGLTTLTAYSQNVYFKLAPSPLDYATYSSYHIVFYARFSSDIAITGKTYDTIKMVLYSDLNNKFSNTDYTAHLDFTYTSSWYKFDISIASAFPSDNNKTSFQYFRLGSNHSITAGTLYIDDLSLVCGDMRAENAPSNETNDLSNSIAIYSNWTTNFTMSTYEDDVSDSTLSSYSKRIVCDDSASKYPFFDTVRLGQNNNAGKTLTFDIKNISNWTGAVQIKFRDGDNVYTAKGANISTGVSGVTGMTYTALSNGWYRVSVVFDTAATALTGTAYSDGGMPWSGFQFLVSDHAQVGILLIDNMKLA